MTYLDELTTKQEFKLPVQWGFDANGLEAIKRMTSSIRTTGKHGIVATIPIVCQGENCPYIETCAMNALSMNVASLVGQRCPIEVSKIITKFEEYVDHFKIDIDNVDQVVLGLLKDLIDYEIQIERADNIMAKQGDFLENVVVGISADGRAIMNKEVAKPIDYKERAMKKKHDILQLLNSTPKDKAGQKLQITMDPSTYAAQLMARAEELKGFDIIDVEALEKDNSNE